MVYNACILVLSIPFILLMAGSLLGIASIYIGGLIGNQHIYLLVLSLLYFLIHYSALLWGLERRRLNKETVKYLCVADALSCGYLFLSVLVGLEHTLKDFIYFVGGEQLALEHRVNLVVSFVVFLAVLLRIAFVVYFTIRSKRSTGDGSSVSTEE